MSNAAEQTDAKADPTLRSAENGHDLPVRPAGTVELSPAARVVLQKRYLRLTESGDQRETVEDMFWRVAREIAPPHPPH